MDQTKSNFYESQIFEAIETIALGITSKMQFDKTVICTITDDKNKDKGEYEVNDGSITFKAYSEDTGYSKDTVVYVLIPQGDYENQKTIIGRYVDDSDSAVKYIPSSDSIIPIKIFESPKDEEYGLLANGTSESEDKSKSIIEIEFTDFDLLKDNTHIYDCVSIQGDFRTDLNSFDIIEGDYGLVLILSGYYYNDEGKMITIEEPIKYIFNSSEMYGNPYKYNIPFTQDIVFDLNENLKNIKITSMALYFYQNDNFKELQTKELIPYKTPVLEDSVGLGGIEDISVLYPNNLFVKNIKVQFGYSLSSVKEESVKLYTPDNEKYRDSKDTKELLLKWFKKNEESGKVAYSVIDQDEELSESDRKNTSIFWYRYAIDSKKTSEELITGDEEEPILGKQGFYWELKKIYNNFKYNTIKKYQFKYTNKEKTEVSYVYGEYDKEFKNPLTYDTIDYELEQSDEGKYTVFYSTKDSSILSDEAQKKMHEHLFLATDETPKTERYNIVLKTSSIYAPSPTVEEITNLDSEDSSIFNMQFSPSEYLIREKIKAVLRKNSFEETSQAIAGGDEEEDFYIIFKDSTEQIETNELIFENVNSAELDLSSVELIRNMQLNCLDDSNGIYLIYNEINNQILEPKADNCIQVKFDNYCSVDIPRKEEKCKITWKIPFSSTMIQTVDFTLPYETQTFEDGNTYYILGTSGKEGSNSEIEWQEDVDNNCYYCEYYWTIGEETTDKAYLDQTLMAHYALKPTFIRGGDNRIICEIEKYGNKYTKEINMVFGAAGTAGTSYTLVIELEKEYGNGDTPNLNNPTSKSYVQYLTKETTVDVASNWVKAIATLYNEKNQVVQPKGISWDWHNDKVGVVGYTSKDNSTIPQNEIYIRVDGDSNVGYYGILKASAIVSWLDDDTTLNSYKPLGVVLKDANIAQYVGTEKIIYDAAGKKPSDTEYQRIHQVKNNEGQVKEDIKWNVAAIDTGYNEITDAVYRSYMPTFVYEEYIVETITNNGVEETMIVGSEKVRNNILTLKPLYFKEIEDLNLVIQAKDKNSKVVYSQSLFYGQNAYDIQMLNVWGGEQIIDAEGNRILSALIGAGIKESDNTFSGVFLGDIERVGADKKTGLLGFNQGIHTFGFHTDGTAFIGQSGGGRIEFDGKEGTITSGNYEESKMGTKIDLDDGSIELNSSNSIKILKSDYDGYLEKQEQEEKRKDSYENELNYIVDEQPARQIILNTSASANKGEPVFEVSSYRFQRMDDGSLEVVRDSEDGEDYIATEKVPLIHIGEKEYYLQSYNFKETEKISDGPTTTIIPGKGVKIDLENNLIKAYNFIFEAGYDDTDSGEGLNKSIYISTEDEDTPLKIGDNFSVSWIGQLTATDGIFSGKITAKSGTIGNWIIEENALYYGGNATLEEKEDNVDGLNSVTEFKIQDGAAIFSPTGVKVTGTAFDVTDWGEELDKDGKYTGTTSSKATFENVVLAVGTNFVLTNDGKLYIKNAQIGGYVQDQDLTNTSKEFQKLLDVLEGEVDDSIEEINTNIGRVNLKAEGSIVKLGELDDNAIYLSRAYGESDDIVKIIEGKIIDDDFTKFYAQKIVYADQKTDIKENEYFYDLIEDKYYCSAYIIRSAENDFIIYEGYDLKELLDPLLPLDTSLNKGYVQVREYTKIDPSTGKDYTYDLRLFYLTKNYEYETNPVDLTNKDISNTYFFDIETAKLYQYDDSLDKYILTDPDELSLFVVSTKGLLTASNAVISGTIYANAGHIGGWTIQRIKNTELEGSPVTGSLTYGNTDAINNGSYNHPWAIDETDANLTPGGGLLIENETLFGVAKGTDSEGNPVSVINSKWCTLNIGQNFAVTSDGILHAKGAFLGGDYLQTTKFETFSTEINDKINYWNEEYGSLRLYDSDDDTTKFVTNIGYKVKELKKGVLSEDMYGDYLFVDESNKQVILSETFLYYDINKKQYYRYDEINNIMHKIDVRTFEVPTKNLLNANNAVISGTIYATHGWFSGVVTASEGEIGGWTLNPNYLFMKQPSAEDTDDITVSLGLIDKKADIQYYTRPISKNIFQGSYHILKSDIAYYKTVYGNFYIIDQEAAYVTVPILYYDLYTRKLIEVSSSFYIKNSDTERIDVTLPSNWTVEWPNLDDSYIKNNKYFTLKIKLSDELPASSSGININEFPKYEFKDNEILEIVVTLRTPLPDYSHVTYYFSIHENGLQYLESPKTSTSYCLAESNKDELVDFMENELQYYSQSDQYFTRSEIIDEANMETEKGLSIVKGDKIFQIGSSKQSLTWCDNTSFNKRYSILMDTNQYNKNIWCFKIGDEQKFTINEDGNIILNEWNKDSKLGGFKLNGPEASDIFWNNALFTNNTIIQSDKDTNIIQKINHYVGFMRAAGSTSQKLSNVFLGCKQISYKVNKNETNLDGKMEFPSDEIWSTDYASYNFYIRFDGKIYTKSIIETDRGIVLNAGSEGIINYSYFVGAESDNNTTNYYKYTGPVIIEKLDGSGTLSMNSNTILTLNKNSEYGNFYFAVRSLRPTLPGLASLTDEQKKNTDNWGFGDDGCTLGSNDYRWETLYINNIGNRQAKDKSGSNASSINQDGINHSALIMKNGGAAYYSLLACKNGSWCSLKNSELTTSDTNIFWDVGIDGTSYKSYSATQDAVAPKYRFMISAGGDDPNNINDQPRVSYVFMYQPYKADSPKTNDNFSSLNRAYFYAKFREGNNSFSTKSSCLGHPSYKWDILYTNSSDSKSLMTETTSNTSDIRLKDIQNNISENQLLSIYNNLNPVAYKYKNLSVDDKHSRTHYGFLAQEVEKIIEDVGLTSEDFAAVQINTLDEPIPGCEDGKKYYLNYNEFHGLHVLKNKEQDNRIQELEDRVQELEKQILELRGKGV